VGLFSYTRFGDPNQLTDNQYAKEVKDHYSKPGTPNRIEKVFVKDMTSLNLELNDCQEVNPPKELLDKYRREELGIHSLYWITDEKLGVVWKNRFQNASSTSGNLRIKLKPRVYFK
jgi:hypothetical protein